MRRESIRVQDLFDGSDLFAVAVSQPFQERDLDLGHFNECGPFRTPQLRDQFFCLSVSETFSMEFSVILTHHVIPILVSNKALDRSLSFFVQDTQYLDHRLSLFGRSELHALFNHVACKLVLRIVDELRDDEPHYLPTVLWFAVLNDMLRDIVPILIHD